MTSVLITQCTKVEREVEELERDLQVHLKDCEPCRERQQQLEAETGDYPPWISVYLHTPDESERNPLWLPASSHVLTRAILKHLAGPGTASESDEDKDCSSALDEEERKQFEQFDDVLGDDDGEVFYGARKPKPKIPNSKP